MSVRCHAGKARSEMMEDSGQLAVPGGALPLVRRQSPHKTSGGIQFLHDRAVCDSVLAFADRHRRALWISVLVFYLLAFNGQWRIQSDAALYLSIGRNLAEGKGFTYLGHPDRLAYPGWPALIAVTFKIFGNNSLFAVNALMLLIALATVAMVYRLFLLHSGRPTAVVISVGVGLTKAFFCYGFELWSDMPFALGVMSALAGYEGVFGSKSKSPKIPPRQTKWIDVTFLVGGVLIAASMRPTIWPLLAALVFSITFQTFRRQIKWRIYLAIALLALCIGGIVLAYSVVHRGGNGFGGIYADYLLNRFSGKSAEAVPHAFSQNFVDLFSWAASDVLFQTRLGAVCNALLSMLVLALGVGLFRYRVLWGSWFCLLLATILVSQDALDRYFLPVLPLLVFAWWDLLVRINRALPMPLGNLVFIGLGLFGGLMNLTKVGGIIVQQRQTPFLARYDHGVHDVTPRFAKLVNEHVGDRAIILAKKPYGRVTAFLSDRCVTNAASTSAGDLLTHPVFVVEPSDPATQNLIRSAGLVEGPALFTVNPSPMHGPWAIALSLHPTKRKNAE